MAIKVRDSEIRCWQKSRNKALHYRYCPADEYSALMEVDMEQRIHITATIDALFKYCERSWKVNSGTRGR